jgi:hypothetical protein
VLGPVLVAIALGVLILVMTRALRRGPAVAPRSAPDHGLVRPVADVPDAAHAKPQIPAQGGPEDRPTVTPTTNGRHLLVRPAGAERARAFARRALSRR